MPGKPEKLVSVRRPLLPVSHMQVRNRIGEVNRSCQSVSIRWLGLGQAACTLMERGEFLRIRDRKQGKLKDIEPEVFADKLTAAFKDSEQMPTAGGRLTVPVSNIDFYGDREFVRVAYVLDAPDLVEERERLAAFIDQENGINAFGIHLNRTWPWPPYQKQMLKIEFWTSFGKLLQIFSH